MSSNPNATTAGAVGVITTAVLWLSGKEHWSLPQWAAGAIATGAISAVLLVGRDGISGLWKLVMHGKQATPPK